MRLLRRANVSTTRPPLYRANAAFPLALTFPLSALVPLCLLGFATLAGCGGGTSGSPDGSLVFVPPFDAGSMKVNEAGIVVVTPDGTIITPPGTDATTPVPDATTTHPPDTGMVATGHDANVVPSNGIVITVIPDDDPTGVAKPLLDAMNAATTSIHMTMYLLTSDTYINALIDAKNRGLDVKVILNETFPTGTSSPDTNATTYTTLTNAGVPVVWSPTTTGFSSYTHEKTVIIDEGQTGQQAWIMTMNLDTDAPKYNREYLAQDTTAGDIVEAEQIFEADYAHTSISPVGNLVVAPEITQSSPYGNAAHVLLDLVQSATSTIDIEAEEIDESGSQTEELIFDALLTKAHAGVTIQLVLEDSSDSSQAKAVSDLTAAGAQVRGHAYSTAKGSIDIHAKALIIDAALSTRAAYVGSENFSGGSLGYNRELGVYFTDPTQVERVETYILKDFAAGTTYSASSN